MKKLGLGLALLSSLAMVAPTQAVARDRDRYSNPYQHYDRDRRGGTDVGAILGAAVVGVVIGTVIADKDNDRDDRRSRYHREYERRGYYYNSGYYYGRDGYYYRDRFYRDSNRRHHDRRYDFKHRR